MANKLLRQTKDKLDTKFKLALFTTDIADNKALAARLAHLEGEIAGVALTCNQPEDALTALVSAAAAYKSLGQLHAAQSCLVRAALLDAGDAECKALLGEAIGDLRKALYLEPEVTPKAAPAPKPAPKAEKKAEKPAPKAEKPAPKAENKAPGKKLP